MNPSGDGAGPGLGEAKLEIPQTPEENNSANPRAPGQPSVSIRLGKSQGSAPGLCSHSVLVLCSFLGICGKDTSKGHGATRASKAPNFGVSRGQQLMNHPKTSPPALWELCISQSSNSPAEQTTQMEPAGEKGLDFFISLNFFIFRCLHFFCCCFNLQTVTRGGAAHLLKFPPAQA